LRSRLHRIALGVAVLVVAALVAVPAFAREQRQSAVNIKVYAKEFSFRLPLKSAKRGKIMFTLVNQGKLPHDFKIAGKKTALANPGRTVKVTVTLKKGKYKYICTVPGHASAGMRGTFTVK
jgi:uncharacterized cupredoxin-like copper-binding protein